MTSIVPQVLDYQEYPADSGVPDDKHSSTGAGLSKLHINNVNHFTKGLQNDIVKCCKLL